MYVSFLLYAPFWPQDVQVHRPRFGTQKFGTWEPLKIQKKHIFSWLQKTYTRLSQQNFMHPRTLTNRYAKSSPKLEARRYIICGKSVLFSFPGCVNRKKIRWQFWRFFFLHGLDWSNFGARITVFERCTELEPLKNLWKEVRAKDGNSSLSSHFEYKMEMITKASWKT